MKARPRGLPADIWERRAALDPERSFIVQAPAGSGKTELLIQRYLTLLARVRQPESILAVTFTVKAAGEMRERVLDAMRRASEGADSEDPNARFTLDLARAALERDREFGWELLDNPARLRIRTIDALCASIAQRMPWLVRFGAMPRVTEQAEALYAEAARATLKLVAGADRFGEAVERLALHLDNDFPRARRMLEALLPRRDQWLRHVAGHADPAALRERLESVLASVFAEGVTRVEARIKGDWFEEMWRVARFAAANQGRAIERDFDGWRFVRALLLGGKGDWRNTVTVRNGFPAGSDEWKRRFSALSLRLRAIEGLREDLDAIDHLPSPRFSGQQWEVLESLLVLLPAAAAQLRIVFQERGTADFPEIAQAAARGLGAVGDPTDLALHLGEQYEHVLVDEVQDTSISQAELLERLTAAWEQDDGHTLFLVGDPMQSIYRFRDAEVGLFARMRDRGIGNLRPEPLTLRVNFRSRPEIVAWVNEAFARIFPREEDEATGAVRFAESEAFRAAGPKAAVQVHPFFGSDPRPEAVRVADLAVEARKLGTTAILVRSRAHVPEIAAELQRRGITYEAVEQDLLTKRSVVLDLLALTRALLHRADRAAWLAVLRAPWCGLALADLHAIASVDPRAAIWDLLPAHDANPRVRRVLAALTLAMMQVRREPLRECVEAAWRALGGPACLEDASAASDAGRFLALIEELDEGGEIADLAMLDRRVETLFARASPDADGSLRIMTIHKAKGLQFDTVILPGLGRDAMRDDKSLLLWAEIPRDGRPELVVAPVESAEDEDDPVYRYLRRLDQRKAANETARLLYVAATRAKEKLHLLGHVAVKDAELKPRSGSLLTLLWPSVKAEFHRVFDTGAEVSDLPTDPPRGLRIQRLPESWAGAGSSEFTWSPAEREDAVLDWAGDTLRHVGTVVHRWLQQIVADGVDAWDGARVSARTGAIRSALEAIGVPPGEVEASVEKVREALVRTLSDQRGRWILRRRPVDACEYAIAVPMDGALQHCVVDRTFVDDGTRWVIDYKTSAHEGGSLESFLDREQERYRAQLARYARLFREFEGLPVRLALYFPLLGGWREWSEILEEPGESGQLFGAGAGAVLIS